MARGSGLRRGGAGGCRVDGVPTGDEVAADGDAQADQADEVGDVGDGSEEIAAPLTVAELVDDPGVAGDAPEEQADQSADEGRDDDEPSVPARLASFGDLGLVGLVRVAEVALEEAGVVVLGGVAVAEVGGSTAEVETRFALGELELLGLVGEDAGQGGVARLVVVLAGADASLPVDLARLVELALVAGLGEQPALDVRVLGVRLFGRDGLGGRGFGGGAHDDFFLSPVGRVVCDGCRGELPTGWRQQVSQLRVVN